MHLNVAYFTLNKRSKIKERERERESKNSTNSTRKKIERRSLRTKINHMDAQPAVIDWTSTPFL